ncbi:MAG: glycyl radical protein [Clostridia bacterium]|nr:glycyl radical protein [Clostridia bacterium]
MREYREVPARIARLREELFGTPTEFCFARARIVTRSYRETAGEPPAVRRARAVAAVFREMPVFLRPGEQLVGQRAERLAGRSVYPEYNLEGLTPDNTPPEVWSYWRDRSIAAVCARRFPERVRLAEAELAAGYVTGTSSGYGHVIVDYEKVLKKGFLAIATEAEAGLDAAPADDTEGRAFLQAVVIAAEGIVAWAGRYADEAEREADTEPDPARQEELREIARTCRHVPAHPARTFAEALQSFWFTHLALHIEQYGWSISAGRFDQYMYPFFRRDLDEGRLTREEAWERLLGLWIKFMENVHREVGDTVFQNLTLGGRDAAGGDMSNELSWMCLDATLALRVNQPAVTVRWHPGIDPAFRDKVLRTVAEGLGIPALFNDEVIIPALVAQGVAPEDAAGYALIGCVEAGVPGKQMGVTAGGHINCAKALELALNDGVSMRSGARYGLPTGDPAGFRSFDDLWAAYRDQAECLSGLNLLAAHISSEVQKEHGHCPLMSSLLDGCIASRRDMVCGGTRYSLPGVAVFGPANASDGLTAVKKHVFEDARIPMAELRQALLDDFAGREDLRLLLANRTPRYGNDDPGADAMFDRVNAVHAEFYRKQADPRGGHYTCGVWPVNGHVSSGARTAATPDGRHAGAPLVDGVGACQGADRKGPTALLRSVAGIDNIRHWPAGNTCNIKLSASSVRTGEGIGRLRGLVAAFMELGGQELQVNVVDAATLTDAVAHPERYRDLVVRVAGYSAYFTRLAPAIQDEILSRTTHSA